MKHFLSCSVFNLQAILFAAMVNVCGTQSLTNRWHHSIIELIVKKARNKARLSCAGLTKDGYFKFGTFRLSYLSFLSYLGPFIIKPFEDLFSAWSVLAGIFNTLNYNFLQLMFTHLVYVMFTTLLF